MKNLLICMITGLCLTGFNSVAGEEHKHTKDEKPHAEEVVQKCEKCKKDEKNCKCTEEKGAEKAHKHPHGHDVKK